MKRRYGVFSGVFVAATALGGIAGLESRQPNNTRSKFEFCERTLDEKVLTGIQSPEANASINDMSDKIMRDASGVWITTEIAEAVPDILAYIQELSGSNGIALSESDLALALSQHQLTADDVRQLPAGTKIALRVNNEPTTVFVPDGKIFNKQDQFITIVIYRPQGDGRDYVDIGQAAMSKAVHNTCESNE